MAYRSLVVRVVDGKQVVLLGHEEEHGAHHHGDCRFVDLVWFDAGQEGATPIAVGPRDGVHQEFSGSSYLGAEPVCDLGL